MDTVFFKTQNPQVNARLQSLLSQFEQTKLTREESEVFHYFKKNVQNLLTAEQQLLSNAFNDSHKVLQQLQNLKVNLSDLSKIQLTEGREQMSISKSVAETVQLFTQIEIYILVILAVLIQLIVMYKPKEQT